MAYTTTLSAIRTMGIGVEVQNETLGTGDNLEDSFDLANGNVVASSYTVEYGASGSNDLTELTETTHYTIDKDAGSLLLTSAGVTALSTNVFIIHSPCRLFGLLFGPSYCFLLFRFPPVITTRFVRLTQRA